MSVYSVKGKRWRYNFVLRGTRYTKSGFKTKTEAKQAEAQRREAIHNPKPEEPTIPIDMAFLELVNKRLDHVKAYNSRRHYTDHIYQAKKWVRQWGRYQCSEINAEMIRTYLLKRLRQRSGYTANKDLRQLRALFNFARHPTRKWMDQNPTDGIEFFPVEKRIKYVPPKEDVLKVVLAAEKETRDYLWTVVLTMARISEINRLTWQDVDLNRKTVVLYTRKKRGGHLTPRIVPMPDKLFQIMQRRFDQRDKHKPWVFWHRYWDRKQGKWVDKPYEDRSQLMRYLCEKAGVKYFRFHALRHYGASMLDAQNIPIGSIQRLLGHENRTTTEIYLHAIGDQERLSMAVFDRHFENFSHTDSHTKNKRVIRLVR